MMRIAFAMVNPLAETALILFSLSQRANKQQKDIWSFVSIRIPPVLTATLWIIPCAKAAFPQQDF